MLIHTLQGDEQNDFSPLYQDAIYFFQEAIGRSAVPVFFVISGYLFFYKVERLTKKVYTDKLKRRVTSLLIPYLMWNALALLHMAVKHLPMLSGLFSNIWKQHFDFLFCLQSFWSLPDGNCPINFPLWYVRDLMVCVVLTPFISIAVRRLKIFWFLLLFLGMILEVKTPQGLGLGSIFYFSVGCYWSTFKPDRHPNKKLLLAMALCWIPLAVVDTMTRNHIWHLLSGLFGVGGLYSCGLIVVRKLHWQISRRLIHSVFFVFAVHAFFVGYISKAVFTFLHTSNEIVCFLLQFVIMALTVIISCQLYFMFNHYAPKPCRVLTGRR